MIFLSTPSARRATRHIHRCGGGKGISIHALREEGDVRSRSPYRTIHISIHALREEGDGTNPRTGQPCCISIHALREEGDHHRRWKMVLHFHFYPRPPRGGRPFINNKLGCDVKFLSTPSARRATNPRMRLCRSAGNFYPRPPRGGRRACMGRGFFFVDISIHALREEGDTRPCALVTDALLHFYPRPPRGGRLQAGVAGLGVVDEFLSTPSARRATGLVRAVRRSGDISIHALREEGDSKNGEKHLRFCFIIKRSAQIWKSLSKNIRKNSCDLHKTA